MEKLSRAKLELPQRKINLDEESPRRRVAISPRRNFFKKPGNNFKKAVSNKTVRGKQRMSNLKFPARRERK